MRQGASLLGVRIALWRCMLRSGLVTSAAAVIVAAAFQCAVPRARGSDAAVAKSVARPGAATSAERTLPSARSPHWPHIRTMVADYRIVYQSDSATRAREYDWAAAHFDRVVLDRADSISVPEYRRRNPTIALYRYALLWTAVRPGEEKRDDAGVSYVADMQRWYAQHRDVNIESAFLHDARKCPAPAPLSADCRVQIRIWTQQRWVTNPGDAGARRYHADRLRALAADADGLFIDEHGSGDIRGALDGVAIREYPQRADFERDVVAMLRSVRAALGGGKRLLLNTAEWHTAWDREMIAAAGGTHAEQLNDATSSQAVDRWSFLDGVIADGAIVDVSPKRELPSGFDAGNSPSATDRRLLWQLASYYMVVPTGKPDAVAFNLGPKWDRPFSERWMGAVEVDLGRPVGDREIAFDVPAPGGHGERARVWMREFERAIVLVRPADEGGDGEFGDGTAVAVPFVKGGVYRPVTAEGSVGPGLDRLVLRAGEAAILLKPAAR